jgi:prepilin-type N-terminal cleavage/methylation domain-containing protein
MKGFTLIELILTMSIIAILSVVGIGSYTQATLKSRDTQRKNDLNQIAKALELFNNDVGSYPKADGTAQWIVCTDATGVAIPCGGEIFSYSKSDKAIYMEKVPSDPTSGRKYVYEQTSSGFALYAALENTQDRDAVVDPDTKQPSDWGINCGSAKCNYKLSETGLIRAK